MSSIGHLGRLAAAISHQHWQQQAMGLAVAASQALGHSRLFSIIIKRPLQADQEVTQQSCWDNAWQGCCHVSSCHLNKTVSSSSRGWSQLTPASTRLFHSSGSSSSHNSSDDSGATTTTSSSSSSSSSSTESSSGRSKDMAIVFTCVKCDTRSVKAFSRQSYEKGLVLIRCPGCQSLHLIADHLGWFGDTSFKIDDYMAAQGQQVKRMSLDPAHQQQQQPADGAGEQLAAEDIAGWSKVQQLLSTVAAASGGGAAAGDDTHKGNSCGSSGSGSGTGCGGGQAEGQVAAGGQAALQEPSAGQAGPDHGVVQVAPEDVEAWVRVQQQQQQ